jgi:hypothetical protein
MGDASQQKSLNRTLAFVAHDNQVHIELARSLQDLVACIRPVLSHNDGYIWRSPSESRRGLLEFCTELLEGGMDIFSRLFLRDSSLEIGL